MKDLNQLYSDWSKKSKALKDLQNSAPRVAGIIAVAESRKNIDMQKFNAPGYPIWEPRKASTNKSYDRMKGSVYNSKNPLLKQTGNLYSGIKYIASGKRVSIGVNLNDVPYAKANNEGNISTHLPKRKFLGYTSALGKKINLKLETLRKEIFNTWTK
jgi:hypothetical protein